MSSCHRVIVSLCHRVIVSSHHRIIVSLGHCIIVPLHYHWRVIALSLSYLIFHHCSRFSYLLTPQIAISPPGTQGAIRDISKFHRGCPILPHHKRFFCVQGAPGEFYVQHCVPFGACSAEGNAGSIFNAAIDILQAAGVGPMLKWVDDSVLIRSPSAGGIQADGSLVTYTYPYELADALLIVKPLQVPWHKTKCSNDFLNCVIFLGMAWDFEARTVSLPLEKRMKFLQRCSTFLEDCLRGPVKLLDLMKIHGSLCHIAYVYVLGKSRLASLSLAIARFQGNSFTSHHMHKRVLEDIRWWINQLSISSFTRTLQPPGPLSTLDIYVDASTSWGVGVLVDGKWVAWQLVNPDWDSDGRNIGCLEAWAVELVIYILEMLGMNDITVLIHSDNTGVISSFDRGRSRGVHINLSVRRASLILLERNITLKLEYIKSEDNPADPISRGILPPLSSHMDNASFSLPEDMSPHIAYLAPQP